MKAKTNKITEVNFKVTVGEGHIYQVRIMEFDL